MPDMREPLNLGESVPVDRGDLGTLHAIAHESPGYPDSDLCHRISRVVGWRYDTAGKRVDCRTE